MSCSDACTLVARCRALVVLDRRRVPPKQIFYFIMRHISQLVRGQRRTRWWFVVVLALYAWVEHSRAFVNVKLHHRPHAVRRSKFEGTKFTAGGTICRQSREENAGSSFGRVTSRKGLTGRQRGDNCSARPSAVRSLRASLDMSPIDTADVVEFVARALQEQGTKHHWQSGFIGGSVGVIGTLTAIKIKVNQVRELTSCPYCKSTGQITCATCFGVGSVSIKDTIGSTGEVGTTTLTCPTCRGKGYVTCVNCKGDGRAVPLFLNKKVSRDPESEIEDVGYA